MTSPDGSVIALNNQVGTNHQDGNGTITDATGNMWSIVGGQVAVNGAIDQTTNHVTELAYKGEAIWQENADNLWRGKSDPSQSWGPDNGTGWNPLSGYSFNFAFGGDYQVGTITGGTMLIPFSQVTAEGINLNYAELDVAQLGGGPFTVNGNSLLYHGTMTGTGSDPGGSLVNNGAMVLSNSTILIGSLTGSGYVAAVNDSNLTVSGGATSETIYLRSSHLDIGVGGMPVANPAMSFLAPINVDQSSSITIENTQATSEVFAKSSPTVGELMIYNGSTMVADLHVSGTPYLFAYNESAKVAGGGSVHLSSQLSAGAVPLTIAPHAAA